MQSTTTFSHSEIENLKKYKYNGTDDSIFAKLFLRKYWDWLISFFPLTIAANTITFVGFLFEFISFIVSFSLSDSLESKIPSWAMFLNGLCLFIYQTLDNLDGRQARRTGTSSALGQFFDHGCDAITGVFIMLQVITTLNLGNSIESFVFVYLMGIGFALTSYEEYVTHSFYLGYLNAPDEGLFLLSIFHVVVAFFPDVSDFLKQPFIYLLYLVGASSCILPIFVNVIKKSIFSSEMRQRAIIGIIPLLISITLTSILFSFNPSATKNTFIMFFSSLLLQYQAQLTIVAFLVKRDAKRLFDPSLYIFWSILFIGILFSNFLVESILFWIISTFLLIIFIIIFDVGVIHGLSEALSIPIFSVSKEIKRDSLEPCDTDIIRLDIKEDDEENEQNQEQEQDQENPNHPDEEEEQNENK